MNYLQYLLNLPWTLLALMLAIFSIPLSSHARHRAIIIKVHSFWWHPLKGVRAITLGNIVLLGRNIQTNDLDHELIHIDQHMREPFIHPILALLEILKHGSEHSKYEQEAYKRAGNKFTRKKN